ncbi:ejaculatory bulb-specific protein 3-like [Coccinella septempunctata]|uniref:ejaculatory bulb-specific protein 3-like n=1 Tax=Coccinella septempunctata TaxID=41139 RepID=UPI001D0944D6|nr:ejaculatory bulb-specific protein 3-like [Coccinella septempunctata]
MKNLFVICFVVLFGFVVCRPDDKYTTKYDNVNIEEILKSDRLLTNYFNCIMTGEACTPDGQELRKNAPDALMNGCLKCSDKQKMLSKRVLTFMLENKPDMYKKVEAKFDPEGIYRKKYKDQLEAEGIKLIR